MLMIAQTLAIMVIFATVMAWIPHNHWSFRGFDFPRLQILALGALAIVGLMLNRADWGVKEQAMFAALLGCMAYQSKMVLPYTRLWKKQVVQAQHVNPANTVSILVSNVLTPNSNKQALIDLIAKQQPDVVITLETDQVWQDALGVIEPDYPHQVQVPLDNLYGMHLYSRLPLIDPEVKFLLSPEIPSIHTQLKLRSGKKIWLYALHPKPPSPTEAADSTLRDAELLMVGDHIEGKDQTCIVAGDLNDVAWSRTTRLFQRISGLLDPRVGRKFINTFHAQYPFLRWSLDHVFHSNDFSLVHMQRMPNIGSDHFPVLTVLHYDKAVEAIQEELEASDEDEQDAQARILEGKNQAKEEHPEHQQETIGKD